MPKTGDEIYKEILEYSDADEKHGWSDVKFYTREEINAMVKDIILNFQQSYWDPGAPGYFFCVKGSILEREINKKLGVKNEENNPV
jgi:hypothetical protein